MILTAILGAIIIILLYSYWVQYSSRTAQFINKFAGPKHYLLFGNVLGFSRKTDKLYVQMRELFAPYKETVRLWCGFLASVHILTAEDAEVILSNMKYHEKGLAYSLLIEWLKTGLLTSSGAKWQQRRKLLTPAFHFSILRKFVDVFNEHSEILIQTIRNKADKTKIDVVPLIKLLTLGTICETAMGLKLDINEKRQKKYYDYVHRIPPIFIRLILKPWLANRFVHALATDKRYCLTWLINPLLYVISGEGSKFKKYITVMRSFTENIIKTREENFSENDEQIIGNMSDNQNENFYMSKKRLAMLDLLIYNKKHSLNGIDDEGIQEEVDTFVFEGHDTTSSATSLCLMLLASHRDIQEKIILELNDIFGDSKRAATYDDLQKMKYLELCIKESLRLYPSVPHISRASQEDVILNNKIVPAGTEICIHIYNIHRDPKYYPDPEKFDPDRFLNENSQDRHPYAYIPFSAGPRNCIGQKFAMLELKCIVSSILRNFTLEPVTTQGNIKFVFDFIQNSKDGIYVKFVDRH